MRRTSIRNVLLTTAFLALGVVSSSGAIITVTSSADSGPGSLRDAVSIAAAGDSIVFDASTNGTPILLSSGEIAIGVPLTIIGNDTSNTVVSGSMLGRIFTIVDAGTVKLVAMQLTLGQSAADGGALYLMNSAVELWDCAVTSSTAAVRGGGIYATGGSLLIVGSSIMNNTASGAAASEGGGGIYNDANTLTINAGTVLANNLATGASGSGGGLFSSTGTVQVIASSLVNNSANRAGGAIEIIAGILFLTNSDMIDNDVAGGAGTANPGNGGGLHATGAASIAVNGGIVTGNAAAREGGGMWNATGTMTIDGTLIDGNTASGPAANDGGGGVFNNGGTLIIQNNTIITDNVADGAAGSGGGVFNEVGGTLTITSSSIMRNSAVRAGGGIEDNSGAVGPVTLILVALDSNSTGASPGNGGGFHITGPGNATITGGTVNGNTAALEGGGLWNGSGTMVVDGVTINGNTASGALADQGGGGVFNLAGNLTVQNGTVISNNVANGAAGSGGGIMNDTLATLMVLNSTITGNTSLRAGGGIEVFAKAGFITTLTDVTVTNNTTGGNPGNGGGFHITGPGTVNVNGGSFNGNTAAREGGGLWNATGTMTIDGTMIDGNTASGATANDGGGGVFNNGGTLIIQNNTIITDNVADGAAGSGGGVFNEVGGTLTMTGSTITGNTAVRAGGGIEDNSGTAGPVTLTNVTLNNNSTGAAPGNGGGFHITGPGNATITGGTVNGNTAALEGGGLWNGSGAMVVDGVTIDGNTASGALADQGGGGIFNLTGNLTVQNGTVISNNMANGAAGSGGGIMNDTLATLTVLNSTISGNSAVRAGGGIEVFAKAGFVTTLTDLMVTDNSTGAAPGNGGGFHITGPGTVNVNGGSYTNNTAAREGGGLWNATGTMTISGATIDGNTASGAAADDGGGGLFNNGGTLNVQNNSIITNNIANGAAGSGGGVFNLGGTVTVDASTISMNECIRAGGGIEALGGTTIVTSSTLNDNDVSTAGAIATIAPGNGGAVHMTGAGTFTISGSTVDGNAAGNEAGGLWASNAGAMTVSRSTVSNNTAPDGGGLFLQGGGAGTLAVEFSTISGNTATNGGGVQTEGGALNLLASTFANNTAITGGGSNLIAGTISANSTLFADNTAATGPDFNGAFTAATFTLVENGSGATGISDGVDGNRVGVDPGLMPLMDNGGATMTIGLLCSSAAINAGEPTLVANDQRGLAVFNGQRDMGAFELQVDCTAGCDEVEVQLDHGCIGVGDGWATVTDVIGASEPFVIVWSTNESTPTISGLLDGDYWVIVKDAAGCAVKINFTIDCGTVGLEDEDRVPAAALRLFPVPANNILNVEITSAVEGSIAISVLDAVGRRVLDAGVITLTGSAQRKIALDVNPIGSGSYLLQLMDKEGNTTTTRFQIAR